MKDVGKRPLLAHRFRAQREVEEGRRIVLGVNAFVEREGPAPSLLSIDPAVERDQLSRLAAFRARRDSKKSTAAVSELVAAAREDRNLMPGIIRCVEESATLGEIVAGLKMVYGEHGS